MNSTEIIGSFLERNSFKKVGENKTKGKMMIVLIDDPSKCAGSPITTSDRKKQNRF